MPTDEVAVVPAVAPPALEVPPRLEAPPVAEVPPDPVAPPFELLAAVVPPEPTDLELVVPPAFDEPPPALVPPIDPVVPPELDARPELEEPPELDRPPELLPPEEATLLLLDEPPDDDDCWLEPPLALLALALLEPPLLPPDAPAVSSAPHPTRVVETSKAAPSRIVHEEVRVFLFEYIGIILWPHRKRDAGVHLGSLRNLSQRIFKEFAVPWRLLGAQLRRVYP